MFREVPEDSAVSSTDFPHRSLIYTFLKKLNFQEKILSQNLKFFETT